MNIIIIIIKTFCHNILTRSLFIPHVCRCYTFYIHFKRPQNFLEDTDQKHSAIVL